MRKNRVLVAATLAIGLTVLPAAAQESAADAAAANANNPLANMIAFNMFIEPQFTILHDGVGQPALQIFAALNMQFLPK